MKPTTEWNEELSDGHKPNTPVVASLPGAMDLPALIQYDPGLQMNLYVSCWQATPKEMEEFAKTGQLYLFSWGVQAHVALATSLIQETPQEDPGKEGTVDEPEA